MLRRRGAAGYFGASARRIASIIDAHRSA